MSSVLASSAPSEPEVRARSRPRIQRDLLVLVAGSVLLAVPFIALHHVNTIDGPAHVLGGKLLGSLGSTPVVGHYYDFSYGNAPNILTQLLLGALMGVLSPTWAEKVLVVAYIVMFPLSVRYAIRSVNKDAGWLALISLPFVVGYLFLLGFYDFSYGMIGAMVAIGTAIRFRGRWSVGRCVGLAAILIVTYAAHVVPAVMAVVVIATITAVDAVGSWLAQRAEAGGSLRSVARDVVLFPALAVLPLVVLTVLFVSTGSGGGLATQRKSLTSLVGGLVTLTLPTVSYSRIEVVAAVVVALLLAVLIVLAAMRLRTWRPPLLTVGLAAATLVCAFVYFAAPDDLGTGSYLNDRLCLFVPLLLLLLLASVPLSARTLQVAGVVGLCAALVAAGARLPTQVRYDRQVTEYLTVERAISPGSTLVAFRFSVFSPALGNRRYKDSDPLAHEASRVAADVGAVDLRHLEGQFAYYPDRFRPHLEYLAQRYLNDYDVPPNVNLSAYNKASGRAVGYVLLVGLKQASAQVRNAPGTRALEQVLERDYVRVMVTQPTGLVELYRHR